MRAAEEIKTAAEYCFKGGLCHICPYNTDQFSDACMTELKNDLSTYFDQLEAAHPKWISVEERLPEPEKDILVLYRGKYVRVGWYSEECNDWKVDDGFTDEVTHWIPLPEPPEEENENA